MRFDSDALREAKWLMLADESIQRVQWGPKWVNHEKTHYLVVSFTVAKKRPLDAFDRLHGDYPIPETIAGIRTDVIEDSYHADFQLQDVNTSRRRPCPGGFSGGHPTITAGTIGAPVWYEDASFAYAITNAHVGAPHWDGGIALGDHFLQPGPHDGGRDPDDWIGTLHHYVQINMENERPPKDKNRSRIARYYWKAARGIANAAPRLVSCPYRLVVTTQAATQPNPNRVDQAVIEPRAGIGVAFADYVDAVGRITGVRNAVLHEHQRKNGRTTGFQDGDVTGVSAMVRVGYGAGRVAVFDNQFTVVGRNGAFSTGGDSGSVLVGDDLNLTGHLFAGGGGSTIANQGSDVVTYGDGFSFV